MTIKKILKAISSIITLVVVLYFGIILLLIAKKANNHEEIYFTEIFISVLLLLIIFIIINKINGLHFVNNKNQIILDNSLAHSITYDLNTKSMEFSASVLELLELNADELTIRKFMDFFPESDRADIMNVIDEKPYTGSFLKVGNIRIDKSEKCFQYKCKVLRPVFNKKILCFWLIDQTLSSSIEDELMDLVSKYRVLSFELSQIINILPIGIWRSDLSDRLIYNNSQFDELKAVYNIDINSEEFTGESLYQSKKLGYGDSARVLKFSKVALHDGSGTVGYYLNATELELANKSTKTLENLLGKIIDNVSIGFLILTGDMQVVNFNSYFANLFNLDARLLEKKPSYQYIIELLRDNNMFSELTGFKEKHLQDIRKVKDCVSDLIHMPNGSTIKLTIILGKDDHTILIYENITPSLKIERELTQFQLMFNSMINMIDFPMVIISQNAQINFINDLFIKTFFKKLRYNEIPNNLKGLMTKENLILKNKDIIMLKDIIIESLESKNCLSHKFKHKVTKFTAYTLGLDDLSTILIIKKEIF